MSRYINLDEAKARTTQLCHGYEVEQWLDTIPSINIDRPQGEWVFDDNGYFHCSECNRKPKDQTMTTDFCPNCGARMKGADDERG